jgi:hypothetical protein
MMAIDLVVAERNIEGSPGKTSVEAVSGALTQASARWP